MSEPDEACPCRHTTPCHPRCTCILPLSSSGCRRCCSYGSKKQQVAMAQHLAALSDSMDRLTALVAACRTLVDQWERRAKDDTHEALGGWYGGRAQGWRRSAEELTALLARAAGGVRRPPIEYAKDEKTVTRADRQ